MKLAPRLLFGALGALGGGLLLLARGQSLPSLALASLATAPATLPSARAVGASLYHLQAGFETDDGRRLKLAELSGKFHIVALIFTRCPSVCPTLVGELRNLEQRMPERVATATGFALVSIDPEHDTLGALRAYRARMRLGARWTLLRGEPDSVRELAAVLGFSFNSDGSAPAVHSRLVTLLSSRGQVLHQQAGLADDPTRILELIAGGL